MFPYHNEKMEKFFIQTHFLETDIAVEQSLDLYKYFQRIVGKWYGVRHVNDRLAAEELSVNDEIMELRQQHIGKLQNQTGTVLF